MSLDDARTTRLMRSTAEGAALLRAAGHLVRDPAVRGPDRLAGAMIAPGPTATAAVKLPLLRRLAPALVERIVPGALWFEIARPRCMDEVVLEEVAQGVRQVILLGAGLDSRAYRMEDELSDATVFEVDHPVTARHKAERVGVVIGEPPPNVRYVTVDFEREVLADALAGGGFDPGERSVVIWAGVAPYLEPAAVATTLDWFATQAPGSTLTFDYCWQELVDGECDDLFGARRMRRYVARQGEPLRWGIPRGRAEELLRSHGLELIEEIGAEEATRRYLRRGDGSTAGRIWDFGGLIRAGVAS